MRIEEVVQQEMVITRLRDEMSLVLRQHEGQIVEVAKMLRVEIEQQQQHHTAEMQQKQQQVQQQQQLQVDQQQQLKQQLTHQQEVQEQLKRQLTAMRELQTFEDGRCNDDVR